MATTKLRKKANKYRGGFEPIIAEQFEGYGIDFTYETVTIPYTIAAKYTPDFVLSNGVFVESKGYLSPVDRKKLRLIKQQHPERDIRIVFQNANNRISKKSKTTYGEWATKHGFKWAHKRVPKEWGLKKP